MCDVATGASVSKKLIYDLYRAWCEENGIKGVLALKDFAQRLYEAVPGSREFRPREGGSQVPHFAGLRARPNVHGRMPAAYDFERRLTDYLDLGFPADDAIGYARQDRTRH